MEYTKLRAALWSMNFSSDKNACIPDFVTDYMDGNDVIVLVEVKKTDETLRIMNKMSTYNFYESADTSGNQIIIGVKRHLSVTKIIPRMPNVSNYNSPNFLHIELTINSKHYQIIGARIRIGATPSIQDYVKRKEQFEVLANYLRDFQGENVIVLGDFNNSMIRGDESEEYRSVKHLYHGLYTQHYNYHIIKEILGNQFSLLTPSGDSFSWGLSYKPRQNEYELGYIKNDHIIASNNIKSSIRSLNYSWTFVGERPEYYIPSTSVDKYGKQCVTIKKGTPDHAMLNCEIDL